MPNVAPPKPPGAMAQGDLDPLQQMVQLLASATSGSRENADPMMLDGNASGDISGARGATAYARQKIIFEKTPEICWSDGRTRARDQMGRGEHESTRFPALIHELAWGSFATATRAFAVFAAIAESMDKEDWGRARGLTMQAMRWLVLSIESPKDLATAWRLTFLADPASLSCPSRGSQGIDLNAMFLCPHQLTATIGLGRDLEILNRRLQGGSNTNSGGGGGDSNQRNRGPKAKEKAKAAQGGKDATA
jgi:hypothetical protein